MITNLWKIITFVLVVTGATIVVFPQPKSMVRIYKDSGMLMEARYTLSDLMSKTPNDPELLSLSAEIYHLNGEPVKATDDLELAVKMDPANETLLVKLATYYEWNRSPMDALRVWDKIADINPDNIAAQTRLIDYYRYYGFPKIEGDVVANLIRQEQRSLKPQMTLKEERMWDNPLVKELTSELANLTKMRTSDNNDLLFDNLITGMYIIRRQYMNDILEKTNSDPDAQNKIITICLELFVKTGNIERGYAFASNLDRVWNQEVNNRLRIFDVMRWSGMNKESLAMLQKTYQEHPNNYALLLLIAKRSIEIDDIETSITAYEKLVEVEPGNTAYKKQLASLYLDVKQPTKAYNIYRELAKSTGDNMDFINMMAITSVDTGNKDIMMEAAELIGKLIPEDINIARKQAEICIAAKNHERAYQIFRQKVLVSVGNKEDTYKLLEVAELTENEEIIKEAVKEASDLIMDDARISLKVAEMYQAIGSEEEAIKAYIHYLKLDPDNDEAKKRLAQLYLWNSQQKKAYELVLSIANANPGDKNALVEAAKYAEEAGFNEQSFNLYERLYKKYPGDRSIQDNLIRLASWTNKWDFHASLLGIISDNNPKDFKNALKAGDAFVAMQDMQKGIEYLERASALRPDDASLRRKLVKYYGWVGALDKMISVWEYLEYCGLLDKEEEILLAQAYLDINNGAKALRYLEKYANGDTLQIKEGLMLATAFELSGERESSIKVYKRLAKENMGDTNLLAKLGNHALWLDHEDIALDFFKAALRNDTKNILALKGSAQIYAGQNNLEMAIRQFTQYNQLNPDDYEARFQLGELFFADERKTDAFREYKKSFKLINKMKRYASGNL